MPGANDRMSSWQQTNGATSCGRWWKTTLKSLNSVQKSTSDLPDSSYGYYFHWSSYGIIPSCFPQTTRLNTSRNNVLCLPVFYNWRFRLLWNAHRDRTLRYDWRKFLKSSPQLTRHLLSEDMFCSRLDCRNAKEHVKRGVNCQMAFI